MKCEICHSPKEYVRSCDLGRHVKKEHGLSPEEYYLKYVGAKTVCKVCGKPTKFLGINLGYSPYCCSNCAAHDPELIAKRKQTCQIKYGGNSSLCDPVIQQKSRATMKEKYGVEHALQNSDILEKSKKTLYKNFGVTNPMDSEEIRLEAERTNIERYGVPHPSMNKDILEKQLSTNNDRYGGNSSLCDPAVRQKSRVTMKKKYGVEHALQNGDILKKQRNTSEAKFGSSFTASDHFKQAMEDKTLERYKKEFEKFGCSLSSIRNGKVTFTCNKCNSENCLDYDAAITDRIKFGLTPCRVCKPKKAPFSAEELDLKAFIESMANNVVANTRSILDSHQELDIALPDIGLSFEYDGLFWHDNNHKANNYHLKKTEEAKKSGYRLIHIFSDEWINKKPIVQSRIRSLLGKSSRIFARKCSVVKFEKSEHALVKDFLDHNHLQGYCQYSEAYGLKINGSVVSVMTFGPSRFKKDEYELLRFCNILNTNVVGGAGRLMAAFIRNNKDAKTVISYADRRWSTGNLYRVLGFSLESVSNPAYFYVKNGVERFSRFKFQKHKLLKLYPSFSKDLSETEIMSKLGYTRIYDCGSFKFSMKIR